MNMTTLKTLVATSLSLVCLASLRAEITGQWDFESDLSATVGNDLEYFDDVDGPTEQETKFGTTATFGVPGIDGAVASVMKTAKNSSSMGYLIRPDLPGNGGGVLANQWSLVMDLLYPVESSGKARAILQIDDPFTNGNGAELSINANNGVGALEGHGVIEPNTWHRLVVTVDQAIEPPIMKVYIDGKIVGKEILPVDPVLGQVDGRWAILDQTSAYGDDSVLLFTDDGGRSEIGYVASIQFHDQVLSVGYVAGLAGPIAGGIQTDVQVIAAIESFSPAPGDPMVFPESPIEIVLADGDQPVPEESIKLILNGEPVIPDIQTPSKGKKQITYDPGLLEPGVENTVEFRFSDPSNNNQVSSIVWSFTMAPYHLPPLSLADEAMFYMPFEESTAVQDGVVSDRSSSENHGVLRLAENAGDRSIEGVVGRAIDFNIEIGSGDLNYIELSKPWPETPNTFACWMKIDTDFPSGQRVGVMLGNYNVAKNINWEIHTSGHPRIWWNNGSIDWKINQYDMRTGEWEHIAFVRDTVKKQIFFYLNGRLAATLDRVAEDANPDTFSYVGADRRGAGTHVFKGQIDELAVFGKALSPNEVFRLYAAAFEFPEFKFPTPPIVEMVPADDDFNVDRLPGVEVVIDASLGKASVDLSSISLALDGSELTHETAEDGNFVRIRHQVSEILDAGSSHTLRVSYSDTADPPNQTIREWSFTTAPVPTIVNQPQDQSVVAGATVFFSVGVSTVGQTTYQWGFNGSDIPGQTKAELVLKNVQPGQAGSYNVVVTDRGGTVISKAGNLTVVDNLSDDPSESLIVGQVASWSFDDSLASGIEGFDGEAMNGATLTDDARVGAGALSLEQAQKQYVDIDRQVLSDGALAYSSAGWFKVTGGEGRRFLWETSPSNWAVSTEVTPAGNVKAFVKLADGSSHSADSGMVPGIGEWHHFAVTFDGVSGQSAIYYDGEKVDVSFTTPAGVGTADTGGFHIGTYRGGSGRFFEGLIDEVGIWNRVLREDEVAYLAEGNPIPLPDPAKTLKDGLQASWAFEGDFSSSTFGFDGEPVNGAMISDDAKVGNGSVSFTQAEKQYVDVQNQVIENGALAYSSAGWFKVTGGEGRRFLWETSPSNWAVSTEVTPAGNVKAFVKLADGSSHSADSGMVPGIGEWHHFAVTFDGVSGQSAIYYDGEKVDVSFTTPAGVGTADTDGFHIGTYRGGSGRFFEGLIDEVGIWNRVLRADEIVYLAEGNAIPEPDQEVAPVVIDESPKDQIATVGGTVIFEVVASGQGALTYQWTSNGEAIDGATSSTFGLWNIQPSDAGVYGVIVTNAAGSVTSEPGILKVEEAPSSPRDSVAGGLVASWSFDDSLESGIAGFDGEAINGATLTDDARVGSGAISLKQAQGQYVDIDRQVLINGALAYSSAGWFKVTGGEGRRFLWETSPSNWAVSTEVTPAGNVKAFTKLADGSSHSADSGMVPGIGEWHHFTVTFDGVSGQSAIYYDGQKVDVSFATPAGVGTADTSGFHIGAYRGGSGRFFEGLIDEVGIWNRVLSEDEVAYLAEGNPILTPPASLNITRVQISEGNIQIEWEGGDSPFQVQSRTSLSEGFWENVGDPINETNYEEAIDAAMKFFQVVQP
jgi:hypothetical protein